MLFRSRRHVALSPAAAPPHIAGEPCFVERCHDARPMGCTSCVSHEDAAEAARTAAQSWLKRAEHADEQAWWYVETKSASALSTEEPQAGSRMGLHADGGVRARVQLYGR